MKKLIMALLAFASVQSFALEFSGISIDVNEFENMSVEVSEAESAQNYWRSSATSCYAYTRCPSGRTIYCQVYGYNYSNVPSRFSNSCRFMVLPGRAVRCQGYSMQRDYYGRTFWSYVDIPVSCY